MEDLLQSQIRESCRLALPEGLRDLMSDISREVLRAQPSDLYQFIVDYLSALLLTRETMSIACRVCCDVCQTSCQPELEEELRNIGIEGEDLETAKNVVMEYFDKGKVKEGNLLMQLFRKTNITEDMLPLIQEAVRVAFLKHQLVHQSRLKVESASINKRGKNAAKQTLRFYENLSPNDEIKENAAIKIQRGGHERSYMSKPARTFGRLSSTSLAGSFLHLPKYVPYSAHDITSYAEYEDYERERTNIDYTLANGKGEGRKIMFIEHQDLHKIDSCSMEYEETQSRVDEEEIAEENIHRSHIEEEIVKFIQIEAVSVDANIKEETSFGENVIPEFISSVGKEEMDQIESAVDNLIEKNPMQNEGNSDDEIAEEHENEYFEDEMRAQKRLHDSIVEDFNKRFARSSNLKLSIINEETINDNKYKGFKLEEKLRSAAIVNNLREDLIKLSIDDDSTLD